MSLNPEERRAIVELEYEKATSIINQLNVLIREEMWDFVANRLYYALFHAVSALLVNEGYIADSHKGKVILFGQYFVKTGKFSIDEGKLYSRLQTMRELADYNCAFQTSKEEILPFVEPSRLFVEKIYRNLTILHD